jgi:hypothetical protein
MLTCRFAGLSLVLGLIVLGGCGRAGPQLSEVEGTVKMRGKLLDKIHVEFWPEGDGPRSIGMTDDQGRFTLTTDDGKRKGALVGAHRVVLRDTGILGDKFLGRAGEGVDLTKGKKPRIPAQYGDPHLTPLKKEVTSGKCVIELEVVP